MNIEPAPHIRRYDLNDPSDFALAVSTGAVWRLSGGMQLRAIEAIRSGALPRPENLPPHVVAELGRTAAGEDDPTVAVNDVPEL